MRLPRPRVGAGTSRGLPPPLSCFASPPRHHVLKPCFLMPVTSCNVISFSSFLGFCYVVLFFFLLVGKMKIMKNFCQLEKPP